MPAYTSDHDVDALERAIREGPRPGSEVYRHLGFRVLACPSMRYKAAFGPHQLLEGRPGFDEAPRWVDAPDP